MQFLLTNRTLIHVPFSLSLRIDFSLFYTLCPSVQSPSSCLEGWREALGTCTSIADAQYRCVSTWKSLADLFISVLCHILLTFIYSCIFVSAYACNGALLYMFRCFFTLVSQVRVKSFLVYLSTRQTPDNSRSISCSALRQRASSANTQLSLRCVSSFPSSPPFLFLTHIPLVPLRLLSSTTLLVPPFLHCPPIPPTPASHLPPSYLFSYSFLPSPPPFLPHLSVTQHFPRCVPPHTPHLS